MRQIVTGVKKTQNVTDTQALVASPLAAVRVVQRTRTLGTVLSNIVNVTIGIIAIILVINIARARTRSARSPCSPPRSAPASVSAPRTSSRTC